MLRCWDKDIGIQTLCLLAGGVILSSYTARTDFRNSLPLFSGLIGITVDLTHLTLF